MKKEILQIVENVIDGNEFFIVDAHISQIKGAWMIKISVDSDNGIGIDECGNLSRKINKIIEEQYPETDYELEITSPGVGEPLKLYRQYIKNIGRDLKIVLSDGKEIVGKLIEYSENKQIEIEEYEKKKGKIIATKQTEILLSDIKRSEVQISFN